MKRRTSLLLVVVAGLALAGTFFFTVTPEASAQGVVQCSATGTNELVGCNLCDLVRTVNVAINIGASALLGIGIISIIIVGFIYITAASNPGLLQQAKSSLIYAVSGMVIVLLSFVLVKTIFRIAFDSDQTDLFNITCETPDLGGGSVPPPGGTTPPGGGTCQGTVGGCKNSPALSRFMSCFESKLGSNLPNPSNMDTYGNGHATNSNHYGGKTCTDGSHAVDYGGARGAPSFTSSEATAILQAASDCQSQEGVVAQIWPEKGAGGRKDSTGKKYRIDSPEVDHIHINVFELGITCN